MTIALSRGSDGPLHVIAARGRLSPLDVPPEVLVDAYRTHGAILLRGFALDPAGFRLLAERYCNSFVLNESPGRAMLDQEHRIQTVNVGRDAFALHPELSREPWKPDACFFWCVNPPLNGGQTTICDGIEIVANLPPEARDALRGRRLRYTLPATPEVCAFWLRDRTPDDATLAHPPAGCPYTFERREAGIVRSFTRPALHKPMFADDLAFGNYLLFGRYMKGARRFPTFENGEIISDELADLVKATSDPLTKAVDWRENDVLILDNTRFMHGRTAISDPLARRIATMFGYVRFAIPDPEEGPDPVWRRSNFTPPT